MTDPLRSFYLGVDRNHWNDKYLRGLSVCGHIDWSCVPRLIWIFKINTGIYIVNIQIYTVLSL